MKPGASIQRVRRPRGSRSFGATLSFLGVGVALAHSACGSPAEADALAEDAGAAGVAASDAEVFGSLEEALSQSSCRAATANATLTGAVDPAHVSPRSYNNCYKGYVLDVVGLSQAYTGPGGGGCPEAMISVGYGDTPLTQSECLNTTMRTIYYERPDPATAPTGVPWTVVKDQQATGSWFLGSCSLGTSLTGMVAGNDYRVATTARDANNNTRKVTIQTQKPVVCR